MTIIDEKVLDLFRGSGRCEHCGVRCNRLDPHHIMARGMGGGRRLDHKLNLIALCRFPCHDDAEHGRIDQDTLFAIVAAREGVLQHKIRETLYGLLNEPKPPGGSDRKRKRKLWKRSHKKNKGLK